MADNSLQNGTDLILTDEITILNDVADASGAKAQRIKIGFGGDGNFYDVSDTVPLPVYIGGPVNLEIQQIEDEPAANGHAGIAVFGVRQAADTVSTGTDGDFTNLKVDEEGRLKVSSKPASYADITGDITAIQATINTPVAGGTVSGDVSRASNVMAYCLGTFAGVNCTFEGSIEATGDNNWFGVQAVRSNSNIIETATGALSAAPAYAWEMSVNALKRIRVRATARTSGTQSWRFVQGTYATEPIPAAQVTATQTIAGTITFNNSVIGISTPTAVVDVASAAITTTATTAAFTPAIGQSASYEVSVTVATGTNPTLDVTVEESPDGGGLWIPVHTFPRITATGVYVSPVIACKGTRVRYVQTISGTTPSFTRSIIRLQKSDTAPMRSQSIDRTVNLTTLNAVTPSLNIQGSTNAELIVNIGAATTAPVFTLEASADNGLTWYALTPTTLTAVASSTVKLTANNIYADLIRARVSNAGATVTMGYVMMRGF